MSDDASIVKAIIHPAIGVARLGNSARECFIGPEVSEPPEQDISFYRDGTGALKRQAARFRIYGVDANGNAVRELTTDNAEITWQAHLCNRKGQWYEFWIALDIPEASSMPAAMLRNITIADRSWLAIDPGPRSITGRNAGGSAAHNFDNGQFLGQTVPLGELRTDAQGRLLVLGGHGTARSIDGSLPAKQANNDGWFDDTSDGPVTASVKFDGRTLPVTGAWVLVAPPNYAPALKSVRTMWDLINDVRIFGGSSPLEVPKPSFTGDIRPIFERMSMLQWVNAGFATMFGWGGPYDFTSADWLARLAGTKPADAEMRRILYNQFRQVPRDGVAPSLWPWIYGEAINVAPYTSPNLYATIGKVQMAQLAKWADGNFDSDTAQTIDDIDALPVVDRPAMLDRAALEFCIADVFDPGSEMPWIMRMRRLYETSGAFPRIRRAPAGWIEPSYGAALDFTAFQRSPGSRPGDLTRWMAVPWQADAAACLSAYNPKYDKYAPTLWPARVPNHVMAYSDYQIVTNPKSGPQERAEAFSRRVDWQRRVGGTGYGAYVQTIIDHTSDLGLVVAQPGLKDGSYPERIFVEHRRQPR